MNISASLLSGLRSFSVGRWLMAALLTIPALGIAPVAAQESSVPAAVPDLAHLEWRTIGPGGRGGRIVDFAVAPDDIDTIYAGTAQSGVWKTVNGGMSWGPIFDHEGSLAIGGLDVAPTNSNVVWVGTGESNGRNLVSSSWGDGIYKSEDAGRTWQNMGLPLSQHIGRVRIHPTDANTVYVPVIGSLFHDNAENNAARGLWRTRDGGETWDKILSAGERAGFFDFAFDPRDPDVMYATTWERERVDWRWLPTGDDGAIYRSDDGGDSWRKLTNGLPTTEIGKIGVSVCASQPDTVYTIFEGPEGGVFRSLDRGASWERRTSRVRGSHWYAQLRCDPNDPDLLYELETAFNVSHDGGVTFANEMADRPVHVDHHALWINPADSDHLVLGNVGGIYISRDRGENWQFSSMNITQFFEIGVGMQEPFYYVCGGTQDNLSHCGPSATRANDGIVNDDWFPISGGDGFYAQTDPSDTTIIYGESQNGGLLRVDTETGERKRIKPANPRDLRRLTGDETEPEEGTIDAFRWNWSAPLVISRWDPKTIYFGAQAVLRSSSRGDDWEVISPDLTKGLTYDNQMNEFGTVRIIVESPVQQGRMVVGTDDGLVQVTDDGGGTWRATEPLPGVPEMALIRRLVLSPHDADTVYAAASSHEYGDFTPYLMRSTDFGRSWESIRGDLPDGDPIRAFVEHPRNANLLFVGTERGVSVSIDGGAHWHRLNNNLPNISVHDMVIHPRDNDLVVGTHGRGIWILDNLTMLEGMTPAALEAPVHVFGARRAMQFQHADRARGWRGSTYYVAPNPGDGVTIDYWIAPSDEEITVPITLTIHDSRGIAVRRIKVEQASAGTGLKRVVWDMRYDPTWVSTNAGNGGGFFGGGQGTVQSPWVLPGEYEARLAVGDSVSATSIEIVGDPLVDLSEADRRYWHDVQRRLSGLLGGFRAATFAAQEVAGTLERTQAAIEARALEGQVTPELRERLRRVTEETSVVVRALGQLSRTAGSAYFAMQRSTSRPSADQVQIAENAPSGYSRQMIQLTRLVMEEMPALGEAFTALGLPWSTISSVPIPEGAPPPRRRSSLLILPPGGGQSSGGEASRMPGRARPLPVSRRAAEPGRPVGSVGRL